MFLSGNSINRAIRNLLMVLMISLLTACSTTTDFLKKESEEPLNLYLAGVSFTGNFKDRLSNYPHSYRLSQNGLLDRAFVEELKKHRFSHVRLNTDLGESTKSANAVALSLGINLETVSSSYIKNVGYKTVADIYSEILIFDFDSKKVIT